MNQVNESMYLRMSEVSHNNNYQMTYLTSRTAHSAEVVV